MRNFPRGSALSFAMVFVALSYPAFGGASLSTKDGTIKIEVSEGYEGVTPAKPTIDIEAVNHGADTTVLVFSESQSNFASLAEYGDIVRDQMVRRLKDPQADSGEKLELSGCPAIRYEITGISTGGLRMAFQLTVIQTRSRFNQVIGSCLRADFADHKAEFAKIAGTIKESGSKN